MHRAVEHVCRSLATLCEPQVDRRKRVTGVLDAVDSERAHERVAAASFPRPAQAALCRVMKGVSVEVGVGTGLNSSSAARHPKFAGPAFVSVDSQGEVPANRGDADDRVGARVVVIPALSDEVAGIALEPDEVRLRSDRTGSGIATASHHHRGHTEYRFPQIAHRPHELPNGEKSPAAITADP